MEKKPYRVKLFARATGELPIYDKGVDSQIAASYMAELILDEYKRNRSTILVLVKVKARSKGKPWKWKWDGRAFVPSENWEPDKHQAKLFTEGN